MVKELNLFVTRVKDKTVNVEYDLAQKTVDIKAFSKLTKDVIEGSFDDEEIRKTTNGEFSSSKDFYEYLHDHYRYNQLL